MRTSAVLIGDELLNGSTADTAVSWLGARLFENGFELSHVQLAADNLAAISDAIFIAVAHGDAVVLTGGLGPTSDDLTRNALARFLRVPLNRDQALLALIGKRYEAFGESLPDNAALMADLPDGTVALVNQEGSAPGIRAMMDGVPIYALPGVPREMRAMFDNEVLPELVSQFEAKTQTTYILRVALEGESAVAMKLRDWERELPDSLSVAYLPDPGNILVKVSGRNEFEVKKYAESAAELIGDSVYARQNRQDRPESLESKVHQLLAAKHQTLATAESLTGGAVGQALTRIPGASDNYLGGVVAYSPSLKVSLLGLSPALLDRVGTVNPEVAYAMALGVRQATGATWGLATTGVAGPGPSQGQAPGTVYVALVGGGPDLGTELIERVIRLRITKANRELIRGMSVIHALELVRRTLSGLAIAGSTEDVTHLSGREAKQ
ncbi:MAG TPA: CinA family nicotinamide mononucleotide deamidase-related protein [Candidatus Nanopelagicaceae bacterium]|nr:CinA family nicotinamide mononucleotide deamidase-related protein [Candidatus Nanopelagicaceae bacterium]